MDDVVSVILEQRGSTHGDFSENARVAMALRQVLRSAPNWDALDPTLQLVMDECLLKMARAVSRGTSTAGLIEAFTDIAGYATLARRACE